jgi:hypothetical protein
MCRPLLRLFNPTFFVLTTTPTFSTDVQSDVTMAGYRRNLAIIRNHSLRAGIPFFNFFGSMPFDNRSDVTESQLRWQALTSLAYGAKGLLYFCYWTPSGIDFLWGGAMITPKAYPNGSTLWVRGTHYRQAARLNKKLLRYGNYLLHYHSVDVVEAAGGASTGTPNAACIANISGAVGVR